MTASSHQEVAVREGAVGLGRPIERLDRVDPSAEQLVIVPRGLGG